MDSADENGNMTAALIVGLSGTALTADERRFLKDVQPAGLILFSRNCETREQITALVRDARAAIGSGNLLVLIDQEGGRVQRLRPPLGRLLPPGQSYADLYANDPEAAKSAAFQIARLVAAELTELGIDTNCAPVLDVPVTGAHGIIGDRAYGNAPEGIAVLAREVARGYMSGGVLPVIKHIPGHGRATKDSHLDLPVVTETRDVLSSSDFAPFRVLNTMPAAMTAHVVFTAVDPDKPASTSEAVTRDIIRGEIGFDGLLMSDDLSMKALSGTIRSRAESVIRAGSDLALHCNGDFAEMVAAAEGVPQLAGKALSRFKRAQEVTTRSEEFDESEALWLLGEMLRPQARPPESV